MRSSSLFQWPPARPRAVGLERISALGNTCRRKESRSFFCLRPPAPVPKPLLAPKEMPSHLPDGLRQKASRRVSYTS